MKNPKQIVLVVVIVLLLGSLAYLTYLLSNGDSPLGMFNLRASNPQDEVDTFLQENNLAPTQEPAPTNDPSLLAYNSTSPTPAVSTSPMPSGTAPSGTVTPSLSPTIAATKGGVTATLTPSPTVTLTLTPTPTEFIIVETSTTPTIVTELPVAGIGDNLNVVLIGGGALILLALLF
jgi:hypothetical protein